MFVFIVSPKFLFHLCFCQDQRVTQDLLVQVAFLEILEISDSLVGKHILFSITVNSKAELQEHNVLLHHQSAVT